MKSYVSTLLGLGLIALGLMACGDTVATPLPAPTATVAAVPTSAPTSAPVPPTLTSVPPSPTVSATATPVALATVAPTATVPRSTVATLTTRPSTTTTPGGVTIQLYSGLKSVQLSEATRQSIETSFINAFNSMGASVSGNSLFKGKPGDFDFKYYTTTDSVSQLADFYDKATTSLGYTRVVNQDTTLGNIPVKVVVYGNQTTSSKTADFFELEVIGPATADNLASFAGLEVKLGESFVLLVQGSITSGL